MNPVEDIKKWMDTTQLKAWQWVTLKWRWLYGKLPWVDEDDLPNVPGASEEPDNDGLKDDFVPGNLPVKVTAGAGDIMDWPITTDLTLRVRGGTIYMDDIATKDWKAVGGVNANTWAIFKHDGKWLASTWDYLRPTVPFKEYHCISSHYYRPKKGEEWYICVSGLCRNWKRNVRERSPWRRLPIK